MSRYIATRAIRGANALVSEAEAMLDRALVDKGPDAPIAFPNTAYYLPTIYGLTGLAVEKLGQLADVLNHARSLLQEPAGGGPQFYEPVARQGAQQGRLHGPEDPLQLVQGVEGGVAPFLAGRGALPGIRREFVDDGRLIRATGGPRGHVALVEVGDRRVDFGHHVGLV